MIQEKFMRAKGVWIDFVGKMIRQPVLVAMQPLVGKEGKSKYRDRRVRKIAKS